MRVVLVFLLITLAVPVSHTKRAHARNGVTITVTLDESYFVADVRPGEQAAVAFPLGIIFTLTENNQTIRSAVEANNGLCAASLDELTCALPLTPAQFVGLASRKTYPVTLIDGHAGGYTAILRLTQMPRGIGKSCDNGDLQTETRSRTKFWWSEETLSLTCDGTTCQRNLKVCEEASRQDWTTSDLCTRRLFEPTPPSPDLKHFCADKAVLRGRAGVVTADEEATSAGYHFYRPARVPTPVATRVDTCLPRSIIDARGICAAADEALFKHPGSYSFRSVISLGDRTQLLSTTPHFEATAGLSAFISRPAQVVTVADSKILLEGNGSSFIRAACPNLTAQEPLACSITAVDCSSQAPHFTSRAGDLRFHCSAARRAVFCSDWSPDVLVHRGDHLRTARYRVKEAEFAATLQDRDLVFVLKDDTNEPTLRRAHWAIVCAKPSSGGKTRNCTSLTLAPGAAPQVGVIKRVPLGNVAINGVADSADTIDMIANVVNSPHGPTMLELAESGGECIK